MLCLITGADTDTGTGRLVDKVYPNHSTIDDYLGLLRSKHANRRAVSPLPYTYSLCTTDV